MVGVDIFSILAFNSVVALLSHNTIVTLVYLSRAVGKVLYDLCLTKSIQKFCWLGARNVNYFHSPQLVHSADIAIVQL